MKLFKKIARIVFIWIPLSLLLLSIFWIVLLKWVPVTYTPLMAKRSIEFRKDDNFKNYRSWRPLEEISNNMVMAVIASEDNRFAEHKGFDWKEIEVAIENSKKGKKLRGASTISQQTAKNVFLYPSRSWVRKGFEAYFTVGIEFIWGKRRIMEVYLNVAEMGKGIYGAEAAASIFFAKPASKLTRREAALIAATLPNPLKRKPNPASPYVSERANRIMALIPKLENPKL